VHAQASALALFVDADNGNILGRGDVIARREIPFVAHESELTLYRCIVGTDIPAAHRRILSLRRFVEQIRQIAHRLVRRQECHRQFLGAADKALEAGSQLDHGEVIAEQTA
jgi:hypothetical protein